MKFRLHTENGLSYVRIERRKQERLADDYNDRYQEGALNALLALVVTGVGFVAIMLTGLFLLG